MMRRMGVIAALAVLLGMTGARAADYPEPKTATFVAKDFKFHTGEVLPELKIAYSTVGDPSGEPVLVLHGTTGSAAAMLTPVFAGLLFGEGQPLDAKKYFLIIPDSIGAGGSSKPSDGLKTKFPKYNYDDMVDAQYRLVTEALGIPHLRLVIGNSMGGMNAWVWGTRYPDMEDAIVPLAAQPTAMAGRNWLTRRMLIELIQSDPDYRGGDYTTQPKITRIASLAYGLATNGGDIALQGQAPTSEAGDQLVAKRLAAPFPIDTNDFVYQWQSSSDYDPSPRLGKLRAQVLAVNTADDERNPLSTGLLEKTMAGLKNAKLFIVPASAKTSGHGTLANASFYAAPLRDLLATAPKRH